MVGMIEAAAVVAAAAPRKDQQQQQRPRRKFPLPRPDRTVFEESLSKVNEEMETLNSRIQEIKALLENQKQIRNVQSPELVQGRNQLAVMNAEFADILEEKRRLKMELEGADRQREHRRAEARALREKLQFVKVEHLESEIKKLENKIGHTSLSGKEEKKLVQEIKDLTKSREPVKEYNLVMTQITQDQELRSEAMEKIREKDQLLNDLKVQMNEQKKNIEEIREKSFVKAADFSGLAAERNAAYDKVKSLREERKVMRDDFKTRLDEWFVKRDEFQKREFEREQKERERKQAEYLEWQRIKKLKDEENFVEEFTDEIILCDQLASCLRKYVPSTEKTAAPEKSSEVQAAPEGFGSVIVSKKSRNDEDLESWFAGTKPASKGKKGKAVAPGSKVKEKLSLSVDVLSSFSKLKLPAPVIVGDVSKCIEDVKAKREEFVRLQAKAKSARESERVKVEEVEEIASVDGGDGDGDETQQEENGDGDAVLGAEAESAEGEEDESDEKTVTTTAIDTAEIAAELSEDCAAENDEKVVPELIEV